MAIQWTSEDLGGGDSPSWAKSHASSIDSRQQAILNALGIKDWGSMTYDDQAQINTISAIIAANPDQTQEILSQLKAKAQDVSSARWYGTAESGKVGGGDIRSDDLKDLVGGLQAAMPQQGAQSAAQAAGPNATNTATNLTGQLSSYKDDVPDSYYALIAELYGLQDGVQGAKNMIAALKSRYGMQTTPIAGGTPSIWKYGQPSQTGLQPGQSATLVGLNQGGQKVSDAQMIQGVLDGASDRTKADGVANVVAGYAINDYASKYGPPPPDVEARLRGQIAQYVKGIMSDPTKAMEQQDILNMLYGGQNVFSQEMTAGATGGASSTAYSQMWQYIGQIESTYGKQPQAVMSTWQSVTGQAPTAEQIAQYQNLPAEQIQEIALQQADPNHPGFTYDSWSRAYSRAESAWMSAYGTTPSPADVARTAGMSDTALKDMIDNSASHVKGVTVGQYNDIVNTFGQVYKDNFSSDLGAHEVALLHGQINPGTK